MRLYAGIDLHSNNNVVTLIDEKDRVVHERRLRNELGSVLRELAPYRTELKALAVESTYNWYWLVDGLQDAGYDVRLVNTAAVKVYEGKKYTDDKHDARHLAHLLRLGLLPEGHIYPKEERAVRDLLRKRAQLVRQRTMQLLSVQNLWSRNTGAAIASSEVKRGGRPLDGMEANRALAIESTQAVLACLNDQIKRLETATLEHARNQAAWGNLMSIPGVGKILGMTIFLETGDIGRFRKAGNYASYCRCVSSRQMSNGKKKGEGNRKNGNKYLGWAFVEAAHFAIRYNERIKRFYDRKKARRNGAVATKAVGRKLAKAVFHILRDGKPFDLERAFA